MNDASHNIGSKEKIYFGHPINTYGSTLEQELIEKISLRFPYFCIENPNQKHHQEGYRHFKETTGNGMSYFYKIVLPSCRAGIFLPFRDGKWGAGVFGEALALKNENCPIYTIDHLGKIKPVDLKSVTALSVTETQKRVRNDKGESIPY